MEKINVANIMKEVQKKLGNETKIKFDSPEYKSNWDRYDSWSKKLNKIMKKFDISLSNDDFDFMVNIFYEMDKPIDKNENNNNNRFNELHGVCINEKKFALFKQGNSYKDINVRKDRRKINDLDWYTSELLKKYGYSRNIISNYSAVCICYNIWIEENSKGEKNSIFDSIHEVYGTFAGYFSYEIFKDMVVYIEEELKREIYSEDMWSYFGDILPTCESFSSNKLKTAINRISEMLKSIEKEVTISEEEERLVKLIIKFKRYAIKERIEDFNESFNRLSQIFSDHKVIMKEY